MATRVQRQRDDIVSDLERLRGRIDDLESEISLSEREYRGLIDKLRARLLDGLSYAGLPAYAEDSIERMVERLVNTVADKPIEWRF